MKTYDELVSEELIKIRAKRIEKQAEQNATAAYAAAAARGVQNAGEPTFTDPKAAAVDVANSAPSTAPAKRPTAFSVSFDYLVTTFKAGQYSTAKDFYRALERKAGADSPFDKGTGANAGKLFVRDIGKPFAFKTLENNLPKIRKAARTG